MLHIKAEVASNPDAAKAFQPADEVLTAAMGRAAPKEMTVGGKTGQYKQDELGNWTPVTVNGKEASGPSSAAVTLSQERMKNFNDARASFTDAITKLNAIKDPTLAEQITGWSKLLGEKSPAEITEMKDGLKSQLYLAAGQMNLKVEDVDNALAGKVSTKDLFDKVGKQFGLGNAAPQPNTNLPGLSITPKGSAPAPTRAAAPANENAPQVAEATPVPAPQAATPAPDQLADNATQPTDQEERNA
jgi:hypothetical protein